MATFRFKKQSLRGRGSPKRNAIEASGWILTFVVLNFVPMGRSMLRPYEDFSRNVDE